MSLKILFPPSGAGDCIIGIYVDENNNTHSLMVDCGVYTDEIRKIVRDDLNNKIDCLVVTHIDNDHINGVVKMLRENPGLDIEKIIYNGSTKLCEDDSEKERLEKVNQRLGELDSNFIEDKISVENAVSLTSLIVNSEKWQNIWNENVTAEQQEMKLGDWSKLYFLSPTKESLETLERDYKKEYVRLFYERENDSSGSLRELVLLHREKREKEINRECKISASIVNEATLKKYASTNDSIDASISNNASLAFVWEVAGKKCLLLGDANPRIVIEQLEKYRKSRNLQDKSILFDVVKISHHGSSHNTTVELMSLIDSCNFIICGYNSDVAPSLQTIAKIIMKEPNPHVSLRHVFMNTRKYRNSEIEYLKKNPIEDIPGYELNVKTEIDLG